jgi:glycosyltransferase involved in cell wall biosynthesis
MVASLSGKNVVLVHPAWHSCGSHTVFCAQAEAYRALGARVYSLAVGTTPRHYSRARGIWRNYYQLSGDLQADERFHTGPSLLRPLVDPRLWRIARRLRTDNYAGQAAALSRLSPVPKALLNLPDVAHIHCNHFFCMPVALAMRSALRIPIILDTHDIQSRQYQARGARSMFSSRASTFEEMFTTELGFVGKADLLSHINIEEFDVFRESLPEADHSLIYPPVMVQAPPPPTDRFVLTVASNNHPNYVSICWLLEEVLKLAKPFDLRIVGNVDEEVRRSNPRLYERTQHLFVGRAESLAWYYAHADAVLLPTIMGHGLSIKSIEALGAGVPVIATPLALRGLAVEVTSALPHVAMASTPEAFAGAIDSILGDAETERPVAGSRIPRQLRDQAHAGAEAVRKLFSMANYTTKIEELAARAAGRAAQPGW